MSTKREVIDVFNHCFPKEYLEALPKPLLPQVAYLAQRRPSTDFEYRISRLDAMGVDRQILSLGEQEVLDEKYFGKEMVPKLVRIVNDGLASITSRYPNRFSAIGTVTLRNIDESIDELERCVKDLGMLGVQILSNIDSKPLDLPEFDPFYERLCKLNAGLWIHPTNIGKIYDWMNENRLMGLLGWGMDESIATFRLARSGVFERHPSLKVITHHMGVLIPFYADRIHRTIMAEGNGSIPAPLKKPPMDYLRMFNVDTAEGAWEPALVCSHMFYGSKRMLFGTDYPFGAMISENNPAEIITTINRLNIPDEEKRMILGENAIKLLKLQ